MKITRALISVSDKTGVLGLARALSSMNIELLSTGKTAQYLRENGISTTDVSKYTGFPEILDGRVKTLHPLLLGAILADPDLPSHQEHISEHKIKPIQLVVVNLYPFEKVIADPESSQDDSIENIDIGGVTLLRASAKNFKNCVCLSDINDYESFASALKTNKGEVDIAMSYELARKAFIRTSAYDLAIEQYFGRSVPEDFPEIKSITTRKLMDLRYGENPHQKAAVYVFPGKNDFTSVVNSKILHGKQLSYNNILDLDSALSVVRDLSEPACCIVKHTNPCGAAIANTVNEAFCFARDCDRKSSYGGIVAFNRFVDKSTAESMIEKGNFFEAILAPYFDDEALQILTTSKRWSENLRLLECGRISPNSVRTHQHIRSISSGLLIQAYDDVDLDSFKVVNGLLDENQERDLKFAWHVAKYMSSNAICIARNGATIGLCAGQTNRIDSLKFAIKRAPEDLNGAVLASDGFFPFDDSIRYAVKHGIKCIIQPSGSVNDNAVIEAAKECNVKLVFTNIRHFKH
ncbi:MAG: bifunctional phosphoribosylaminoimidazolecarboxamide formyltransferase/IMP cyclohydrolase [Planctomycetes bacterium]|nr:bifunctional phosphoribosylaminoimidazolecarboxamide formyltransferase/IMP cyclohydrolase [Planctomycetota bacterium]